jgi:hypothetical protein
VQGLLDSLPDCPRFDETATDNHKGYTATWEIRAGKLYLVVFEGIFNGKPIGVGRLGRLALPIVADWCSGYVRVIRGAWNRESGYVRPRFDRVEILTVKEGIIQKRVVKRNAGIDDR